MAKTISLHPELTEELKNKLRFTGSEYQFYYTNNDNEYDLICEDIDGSTLLRKITDKNGTWTPDDYNIGIRRTFECASCINLFGPNGIACRSAIIGVALMWSSYESRQRGTIAFGEIHNEHKIQQFDLDYTFNVAQLRGKVEFKIVLYIKEPGIPENDEKFLANQRGYLLGAIDDELMLILDGSGSLFPIYEENKIGGPLWRVTCDWEDPLYDLFGESVKIYLNKKHPSFKYIDNKNKQKFNMQLFQEIIASAMTVIVMKLKSEEETWAIIEQGSNIQRGSLAEVITYNRETLGWKTDKPESLSLSIREYFEKRM